MRKGFYQKFALDSIKKNRQIYLPYMLTCVLMTTLFFIIQSLSQNSGLDTMSGRDALTYMFAIGSRIMAIFSIIFLFYTNSFLMKQRKHEFGLYNVLGLEKRHISRIVFFETIMIGGGSIIIGILAGLLFTKLAFAGIVRLINMEVPMGFEICPPAIYQTILLFVIIHLILFLNSFRQIRFSNTLELLYGSSVGEKEPKTKWPLAVIGIAALILGYGISVKITNPLGAFALFFLAVLLVVIGTYFLFTAGSIAWLKMMKKRKNYYYQPRHFINISGMLYRMKQNAASLASICILSTMVIVTVSTTLSLYTGCGDIIKQRYPREINVTINAESGETASAAFSNFPALMDRITEEQGIAVSNAAHVTTYGISAQQTGSYFETDESKADSLRINDLCALIFLPLEDYNRISGSSETLSDNEILLCCSEKETIDTDTLYIGETVFSIKKNIPPLSESNQQLLASASYKTWFIVVKDMNALYDVYQKQIELYADRHPTFKYYYGVNVDESQSAALKDEIKERFNQEMAQLSVTEESAEYLQLSTTIRSNERTGFTSLYAGFFFVGIFMTAIFLTATILIIYYKQISEGLQDARRFEIMQKVGLSREEIKKSIHSQILMVFFLPLITAGVHSAFAFPIISRFLKLLAMTNIKGFVICLIGTFIVFAIVYILVYFLTARSYYRIVSK